MRTTVFFVSFLAWLKACYSHGNIQHDIGDLKDDESVWQYAQRHMATEHHIDSFDLKSFFQLHDLNRDGFWDKEEIEAIYGVHHVYSQKKSADEIQHQAKADHIVNSILSLMDKNKDGKISPEEYEAAGVNGLPNFDRLGAEGHHYDVESEFFLHHEEIYHNTPETQTDESYNHPEDVEHFSQHEEIEKQEVIKEAKYQGISVEEAQAAHDAHEHESPAESPAESSSESPAELSNEQPVIEDPHAFDPSADQANEEQLGEPTTSTKISRQIPPEKQDPVERFKNARKEGQARSEWGTGDDGYKRPKTPSEKMRKNVPYKYKFRRSWGDF